MRRAIVALLLLILPPAALAHRSSLVYATVEARSRALRWTLRIAGEDLGEAAGTGRAPTAAEARARRERIAAYIGERVRVTSGGRPCPARLDDLALREPPGGLQVDLVLDYLCPGPIVEAEATYDLFFDLDPLHQGIVAFTVDGVEQRRVLRQGDRRLLLHCSTSRWAHARDHLLLGVEHIFTGYDHLAFLLGLLIVAAARGLRAGARDIVAVVTSFTLAHSITLVAAALGWVSLPSRLVEPAIAASIAFVGLENLLRRSFHRRWLLAFGFGLVHGFGFAAALAEAGLPRDALALSLVSFNVGVEVGQLAVVAAALPLLALAAARPRLRYDLVLRRGASALIAALGLLWLAERLLGRSLLGGWLG